MLLVSYAFPPDSVIGALRWQKMTEFAASRGWSVDVLMIDPSQCAVRDDARLATLPAGVRLFGVRYFSYQESLVETALRRWASRMLSALRSRESTPATAPTTKHQTPPSSAASSNGNGTGSINPGRLILSVRRAQLARRSFAEWEDWTNRAATIGAMLAGERPYDVVISSGPPHMAHEAARVIAEDKGLPLVIDFRDPWALEAYQEPDLRSPAWMRLSQYYEERAVRRASVIVMNTDLAAQMMRERYPAAADRVITVMNGADAELRLAGDHGSKFVLSYAGMIYGGRDPRALFKGVRRAIDAEGIRPEQLEVRFMGSDQYGAKPLAEIAAEQGLAGYFFSEPAQVRSAALALLRRSAMVVVLPQKYQHSIPGKVFEYVQAESWVLSLAEGGSATDLLLRQSGADCVAPDDDEGIGQVIARRFREFQGGTRPVPLNADGRFDRERQAARLFAAVDDAVRRGKTTIRPSRFSSLLERLG
ncbi:MAG: glycosyltransferase [Gemmatimonadaceae bacterium]